VDYTNLNKECPTDCFALPKIEQLVDSTSGHSLLSFMDASVGFCRISTWEAVQNHTSFVTDC